MNRYIKGRSFEYRIIRLYEKKGYTCIRSAGSKSPIDAVFIMNGEVKLAQMKAVSYISPKCINDIQETANKLMMDIILFHKDKKGHIEGKTILHEKYN